MSRYDSRYGGWPRYVPVAERRAQAEKAAKKMQKKGQKTNPIVLTGRTIASTFWGKAWCENLESYSDYENRLPRGRTYVRNGSVIDLQITPGTIQALVMGSSLYKITVSITPMALKKWHAVIKNCSGHIDSVVELLQGKFSKAVMATMTEAKHGLFPKPEEISLSCSCPDWAEMCKHVAAALYGVGACLDGKPEWLFTLRQVDHLDLIAKAAELDALHGAAISESSIADEDLSDIFGIDMAEAPKAVKNKRSNSAILKLVKPKAKTKVKNKVAAVIKTKAKKVVVVPKLKTKVKTKTKISETVIPVKKIKIKYC